MQTYTHVTIGAVIGKVIFPDSLPTQIVIIFGAILPDIPLLVMHIVDLYKKQAPFELYPV